MTVNPRQSFRLKLCLSILSVSLLIFLAIFASCVYFSYTEVKNDVETIVSSKLHYVQRSLDEGLACTKVTSDNVHAIMKSPLFSASEESVYKSCKMLMEANPRIQGTVIAFEPGVVPGHENGFAPYLMRHDGSYNAVDLATVKDYRGEPWYKTAYETGEPHWSDPFRESFGTVITSYNVPIRDTTGRIIGVTALDLNLDVITDSLKALKPYPNSYFAIIDADGDYVANENKDLILTKCTDTTLLASIKAGEQFCKRKTGKENFYVFHEIDPQTEWTILLYVPRDVIGQSSTRMLNNLFFILLVGVILLLGTSLYVISRITRPLVTFSEAARQISHGHFHVDLPVIQDHNELYDLRQALSSMEVSLDEYMKQLETTSSKKAAMDKELHIARRIQMSMVPKEFPPYPEHPEIDIYASLTPAQAVGGDLYNFLLNGDKLYFCIGDVSGKGVPASLLMAITCTLFRTLADEGSTPGQIAGMINDALSYNNEMNMFVTMFIASYDIKTGEFVVCNCGHNHPATNGEILDNASMTVAPADKFHLMDSMPVNVALGILPGFKFQEVKMTVKTGTKILLYTDGITEAENAAKDLYSEERMVDFLNSLDPDTNSRLLIEKLVEDVHRHVNDAPQSDDITCLCIRC